MVMNFYFVLVLIILLGGFLLDSTANMLNLRNFATQTPDEFRDVYDSERLIKSRRYLAENVRLEIVQRLFLLSVLLIFILSGGFGKLDAFARGFGHGPVLTGLIFAGVLVLAKTLISLPFSIHSP